MRTIIKAEHGNNGIRNALTVDVEDYFQVSAFEQNVARKDWERIPRRVEQNMDRILELFSDKGVKATFFMLGWVAERYPRMTKAIVDQGHELASHGYQHIRITQQTPEQFSRDISTTKHLLEDLGGVAVLGYRAASFSINKTNHRWAHAALLEAGYRYSSSIYPVQHDLYGIPSAPRFAYFPIEGAEFVEIPVTTTEILGRRIPCGGGGYFRLLPYRLSLSLLRRVNEREGQPGVFYFHPWEIDPQQPRQRGLSIKTRFRHYINLQRTEHRLGSLVEDLEWDRMDKIFIDNYKPAAYQKGAITA